MSKEEFDRFKAVYNINVLEGQWQYQDIEISIRETGICIIERLFDDEFVDYEDINENDINFIPIKRLSIDDVIKQNLNL